MEEQKKSWTIFRVYLLIASLVGLIGGLISLGIALTAVGQRIIVTQDEYVNGQRYYDLEACKNAIYDAPVKEPNWRTPSATEIKTCKEEKTKQILLSRSVDFKQSVLGWGIRAVLFAVLFFTHYPRFRKQNV